MKNFHVSIEGLDELQTRLDSSKFNKKVAIGVGIATSRIHNALRSSVADTYYAPESLDKVLVGKPRGSSLERLGRNVFRTGLEYRFKPIALSKFPVEEKTIAVRSKFLIRKVTGGFRPLQKTTALVPYVKVRRNRSAQPVVGRKGLGGFLVKPSRRNSGSAPWPAGGNARRGVYERQQEVTWQNEGQSKQSSDSLYQRARIKPLFGPTLSQMAGTVFEASSKVQSAVDTFADTVNEYIEL